MRQSEETVGLAQQVNQTVRLILENQKKAVEEELISLRRQKSKLEAELLTTQKKTELCENTLKEINLALD